MVCPAPSKLPENFFTLLPIGVQSKPFRSISAVSTPEMAVLPPLTCLANQTSSSAVPI